jgi:hypothetical protein
LPFGVSANAISASSIFARISAGKSGPKDSVSFGMASLKAIILLFGRHLVLPLVYSLEHLSQISSAIDIFSYLQ